MITRTFDALLPCRLYYVIGWCVPAFMTIAWATVTGYFNETECWTGYNFTAYYWILEGPRMAIIAVSRMMKMCFYEHDGIFAICI